MAYDDDEDRFRREQKQLERDAKYTEDKRLLSGHYHYREDGVMNYIRGKFRGVKSVNAADGSRLSTGGEFKELPLTMSDPEAAGHAVKTLGLKP